MKKKNIERQLICNYHGIATFYKTGIKTIRWKCRKCEYAYSRKYLLNLKNKCLEYLGNKCFICGYNTCSWSLDFHHIDPEKKDFTISDTRAGFKNVRNWEQVRLELDKCMLLCKNCHYECHYQLEEKKEKIEKTDLGLHKKEIHRVNYLILNGKCSVQDQFNKIIKDKKWILKTTPVVSGTTTLATSV